MNWVVSNRWVSVVLLSASCVAGVFAGDLASCRATFDGAELAISNGHVLRKWRVNNGLLYATSLKDLDTGVEWLSRPSPQPAPYPAVALAEEPREVRFSARTGKFGPVEADSLVAELTTTGSTQLNYRFQVFPDAPGISVKLTTEQPARGSGDPAGAASPGPADQRKAPTGVEAEQAGEKRDHALTLDALEVLELAPQHLKLTQVRLVDQTDAHNELVFEDEWLLHTAERVELPGNLFILRNPLNGSGLIFLKEAPLPHARPVKAAVDFVYDPKVRRCSLLGQATEPVGGEGYRYVVLTYSGGEPGQVAALQGYQRQLRTYDPKRDGMLQSNTWGDRSKDSRVNEAFMTKEVHAGARLGVDVIQVDDGWQKGKTSNSVRAGGVWSGFWTADPNFWDVDRARFPNGLAPVIKLAASKGMRFGLWFGPDSANDFANWQKDADKILEIHRALGVDYVKIDGVKAVSKRAEQNLRRFFDRVLQGSSGGVTFDLDVTAETRPGYFGMINVGPLFVENRYTDWHRYWPHQTLRNLWKLARYVDPLRLRMEFLNNARNPQLYADDPLAPSSYSSSYLFATVMFSNPLGWFEISNLPESYAAELRPLIARWKQERAGIFSGFILPIGQAPDGVSWTGFLSVSPDRSSGYALIFREANPSAEWDWDIAAFGSRTLEATLLGGEGTVSLSSRKLRVRIERPKQFVWVKLEARSHVGPRR